MFISLELKVQETHWTPTFQIFYDCYVHTLRCKMQVLLGEEKSKAKKKIGKRKVYTSTKTTKNWNNLVNIIDSKLLYTLLIIYRIHGEVCYMEISDYNGKIYVSIDTDLRFIWISLWIINSISKLNNLRKSYIPYVDLWNADVCGSSEKIYAFIIFSY